MANRKQKLTHSEEGSLSYKRNVVLSIVKLASQEISGIASLSNQGVSVVKKVFDQNYHRGVNIEFGEDDDVYVDVYVNDIKQVFNRCDKKIVVLEDFGESVEVKLVMKNKGLREWKEPVFYVLNESVFTKVYSELAQGNLKLEKMSDTYLRGMVFNDSENKILFFSIPSDSGWRIKVNGENIVPIEVLDTFIGVTVPEGESIIEMIYFPKYFKLGIIISAISIFCAIFFRKKLKWLHNFSDIILDSIIL